MPTYPVINLKTKEKKELSMTMKEYDKWRNDPENVDWDKDWQAGVAKECARFVLPLATPTRIYMTGSCRSWIHYINLRSAHGTQKEHMEIANALSLIHI